MKILSFGNAIQMQSGLLSSTQQNRPTLKAFSQSV